MSPLKIFWYIQSMKVEKGLLNFKLANWICHHEHLKGFLLICNKHQLGSIAYLVARRMADPRVVILIMTWFHTFEEIDFTYNRKYVHKVLVNGLVKLAHEKYG